MGTLEPSRRVPAPSAPAPSVTSLNGHASHYQFRPPRDHGGALLDRTAPRPTGDRVAHDPARLQHGLSRGLVRGRRDRDWRPAAARSTGRRRTRKRESGRTSATRATAMATASIVAYSEELNRLFAQRLAAGSTVGNALMRGEAGVLRRARRLRRLRREVDGRVHPLRPADVVGLRSGEFAGARPGRPKRNRLLRISFAAKAAPTPPSGPLTLDPTTSLDAESFSVNPTNTEHATTTGTTGKARTASRSRS